MCDLIGLDGVCVSSCAIIQSQLLSLAPFLSSLFITALHTCHGPVATRSKYLGARERQAEDVMLHAFHPWLPIFMVFNLNTFYGTGPPAPRKNWDLLKLVEVRQKCTHQCQ